MTENGSGVPQLNATIDGRPVTVPKGTTILEAAETLGILVPHYCYHPGLSSPAMCRLCLVEVEGAHKPMPACVTEVTDGQVVETDSGRAKELRRGVLEFYLVNHPLDCPICDQSGECKLQDYVYAEGRMHGRSREPKRVFGRDDFGGDVLFYGDRCVMCTRCVRFMDEVAQDERLCVVERGSRSIIDTFFEEGLEGSPYAGNIVDICPVGALVSKDFLFKARAWDLDHTPSLCSSCSQGCNIELHTRDNLVQRIKPRENPDVNGHWMCDYGRLNYEWINDPDRIEAPLLLGEDGRHHPTDWATALGTLASQLQDRREGTITVVGSPFASNEDLGALAALLGALGGGSALYRLARADREVPLPGFPTLVRRRELAANAHGAELLGFSRVGEADGSGGLAGVGAGSQTLIVLADALPDQEESFGSEVGLYVYLGHRPSAAARSAHVVLPTTTFAEQEGTFTNHEGRVQRFWPGRRGPELSRPAWLVLGALVAEMTGTEAPTRADQAFAEIATRFEAFDGLDYATIGMRGAPVRQAAGQAG